MQPPSSTAQFAFEVEHVQPVLEHADEGAELVVRGHQFARLRGGFERWFIFAGGLRHVGELDGEQLAVGGGLDFLLGNDFRSCPAKFRNSTATGISRLNVAIDADLPADGEFVLHAERWGLPAGLSRRRSWAWPSPRDWPKVKVKSGKPSLFEPGGRGLRREVAGGIRPLRAVAEEKHAQEPLVGLAQHVVDSRRWPVSRPSGFSGSSMRAVFDRKRMGFGVEAVGLDLEIAGEFRERPGGVAQRLAQRFVAGLARQGVGHRHAPRPVDHHHQRGHCFFVWV